MNSKITYLAIYTVLWLVYHIIIIIIIIDTTCTVRYHTSNGTQYQLPYSADCDVRNSTSTTLGPLSIGTTYTSG